MLCRGMLSRVMRKVIRSFTPGRFTLMVTLVPFLPRRRFWMSLFFIFTPAIVVSFT